MFHELWIGGPHCEIKERLVSALQRHFVLKLCRGFGPSVVHTSNPVYVDLLNKHGLPARELPLFGAIPVVVRNADDWLFSRLREAGITVTAENRSQCWLFGIFGTLHPVWPPEPLFTKLKEAADLARRRIIIVSVGRIGAGQGLWNKMARDYSPGIHFLCLGEQPGERISEVFNSLDFGIATTPLALLGKSASAAAMFEHGLPVIVNRDEIHSLSDSRASSEDAKYVLRLDSSFVDRLVTAPIRRAPVSRLTATTERFLRSLTANQTWLCPA